MIEDFLHLPPGVVVDTGGKPLAVNISANFRKNSKRPSWHTQGIGGNWFIRSRKSRDTVPLRPFQIFSKIRRDIRNSSCTTGINDTGSNFATGVVYTSGKQWEQLSNCWQLKINLKKNLSICDYPKVSKRNHKSFSDWRFSLFGTGVVDTGGKPWTANISANFRKNGIIRG